MHCGHEFLDVIASAIEEKLTDLWTVPVGVVDGHNLFVARQVKVAIFVNVAMWRRSLEIDILDSLHLRPDKGTDYLVNGYIVEAQNINFFFLFAFVNHLSCPHEIGMACVSSHLLVSLCLPIIAHNFFTHHNVQISFVIDQKRLGTFR